MACFEGCFEGEEIDWEAMVPEHQKEFAKKFFEQFLTPRIGAGATPFEGPLTATAFNPFVQGAMGLMGKSPYAGMGNWGQAPGFGTMADYPGIGKYNYPIVIDEPEKTLEDILEEWRKKYGGGKTDGEPYGGKDGDDEVLIQHGFHGTVTGPKTFRVEPGVRERVDASPMGGGQQLPQRPPTGGGQQLPQLMSLIQRLSQLPQRPPMGRTPGMQQMGMPTRGMPPQMPMPMQLPPRRPLIQQPRLPFRR